MQTNETQRPDRPTPPFEGMKLELGEMYGHDTDTALVCQELRMGSVSWPSLDAWAETAEEAHQLAEEVQHRWNAHEDLLEALRSVRNWLPVSPHRHDERVIREKVCAAITKATPAKG